MYASWTALPRQFDGMDSRGACWTHVVGQFHYTIDTLVLLTRGSVLVCYLITVVIFPTVPIAVIWK